MPPSFFSPPARPGHQVDLRGVLAGLLFCAVIFQVLHPAFLSAQNLNNLASQIVAMALLSAGMIPVLLLGHVDLSVGALSGVCAAIMAVEQVRGGMSAEMSMLLGLVAGGMAGALQGLCVAWLGVPSFVVTLAGLWMGQGLLLALLGTTGTVNILDAATLGLTLQTMPSWLAWILLGGIVLLIVTQAARQPRRDGLWSMQRILPLTAALLGVAWLVLMVTGPGIPWAVAILVTVVAMVDVLLVRTAYGRHVYAVGSNAQAAFRAGISVRKITVLAFALCGTLAAASGILAASRLMSVHQSFGGGDVLLNAVAAAVMGGTSLFGGRGRVWSALLGSVLLGAISNGMDLLALESAAKYVVTGVTLLAAVALDAARTQAQNQP